MNNKKLDEHITKIPEIIYPVRILAFDPGGKTTGVIVADVYGIDNFDVISVIQFDYNNRFELLKYLIDFDTDIVIIENFFLYEHKKDALVYDKFLPVRMIGVIETFCYLRNVQKVIYQNAGQIKSKPPVKILPEHIQQLKGLNHAKDAYKHLRLYVAKELYK